ncbi:MAG: hypothetical protein AAF714_08640 [Pseudomonadota bacterium]
MSDPVENYEIEDVLSSIRRLVSQEGARSNPDPTPETMDALVLTPDARVDGKDSADHVAADTMEGLQREAATAVRSELERAIEELEAAMGIAEATEPPKVETPDIEEIDWDAPVGRVMDGPPPDANTKGAEPEAAFDQGVEADVDTITPDDADIESPQEPAVLDLDAKVDVDEEPRSDLDMDPEPQTEAAEADPWVDAPVSEPSPARSAAERLHLVSSQGDSDRAASGPYDEFYDEAPVSPSISPQLEETLAERAENFDAPEPPFDRMKDDPFTATAPAEDGLEAFPVDVFEPEPEPEVALDEEQLRDMVAEIVREELQGELGERITRNVRKLVRREVNRALAGQDLI